MSSNTSSKTPWWKRFGIASGTATLGVVIEAAFQWLVKISPISLLWNVVVATAQWSNQETSMPNWMLVSLILISAGLLIILGFIFKALIIADRKIESIQNPPRLILSKNDHALIETITQLIENKQSTEYYNIAKDLNLTPLTLEKSFESLQRKYLIVPIRSPFGYTNWNLTSRGRDHVLDPSNGVIRHTR